VHHGIGRLEVGGVGGGFQDVAFRPSNRGGPRRRGS
jgi:hypothetical protein